MIWGFRASSPSAARNSAMRFPRFASETKISGQRCLWTSCFETAVGRLRIRSSKSRNAFGLKETALASRNTSRVSESNGQSSKVSRMIGPLPHPVARSLVEILREPHLIETRKNSTKPPRKPKDFAVRNLHPETEAGAHKEHAANKGGSHESSSRDLPDRHRNSRGVRRRRSHRPEGDFASAGHRGHAGTGADSATVSADSQVSGLINRRYQDR